MVVVIVVRLRDLGLGDALASALANGADRNDNFGLVLVVIIVVVVVRLRNLGLGNALTSSLGNGMGRNIIVALVLDVGMGALFARLDDDGRGGEALLSGNVSLLHCAEALPEK